MAFSLLMAEQPLCGNGGELRNVFSRKAMWLGGHRLGLEDSGLGFHLIVLVSGRY